MFSLIGRDFLEASGEHLSFTDNRLACSDTRFLEGFQIT